MTEEIELTEKESKEYIKGFNAGYQLQKHSPQLIQKMLKNNMNADLAYQKGLEAGSKLCQKEEIQQKMSKVKIIKKELGNDLEM